ncbi:MAG: hypothetical protein HYU36_16190 [Planctomycetes bacterium]|nr:hypothetical protein [Planctomycetota bacterium]
MNKTSLKPTLATFFIASGWCVFLVSLALPCLEAGFEDLRGWEAARLSVSALFFVEIRASDDLWPVVVLTACGLSNLVLISSMLLLHFRKESEFYYKYDLHLIGTVHDVPGPTARGAVFRIVTFLLLGATFWVSLVPVVWNWNFGSGYRGFRIGYYVWVASFVLVTAGFLIREHGKSQGSRGSIPEIGVAGTAERTDPC